MSAGKLAGGRFRLDWSKRRLVVEVVQTLTLRILRKGDPLVECMRVFLDRSNAPPPPVVALCELDVSAALPSFPVPEPGMSMTAGEGEGGALADLGIGEAGRVKEERISSLESGRRGVDPEGRMRERGNDVGGGRKDEWTGLA